MEHQNSDKMCNCWTLISVHFCPPYITYTMYNYTCSDFHPLHKMTVFQRLPPYLLYYSVNLQVSMTSPLLVLLENTNCTDCVGVMKCKAKATTFKSANSSLVYWCLRIYVHAYTCIYLLKFPVAGWLCVITALSVWTVWPGTGVTVTASCVCWM